MGNFEKTIRYSSRSGNGSFFEGSKEEAIIEEMRDRLHALDESINDLQNVLLSATEELEKLEGRKEVLKERKKNASNNKEQLEKKCSRNDDKTS